MTITDSGTELLRPASRPSRFYRGRQLVTIDDLKRVKDMIIDGTLWFSPPSAFNDPFEFSPVVAQEREGDAFANSDEIEAESRLAFEFFSKLYRVCCFSADFRDPALWSHYARDHTGIFLIYDGGHPLFDDAVQVRYLLRRPLLDRRSQSRDEQIASVMYCKGLSWCYEKEWRIVAPSEESTQPMTFSNSPLCGVVRGLRTDPAIWAMVEAWITESKRCLQVFAAVRNPEDFAVGLREIGSTLR